MTEVVLQPPYEPNYPQALGPEVVMDERMREALLNVQESIHKSIKYFPDSINSNRRYRIAHILGIAIWDFQEAMTAALAFNAVSDVTINPNRNMLIVSNNSLLNVAALAINQSGRFLPENQLWPYLNGLALPDLLPHVTKLVRSTKSLLGESLLAKGLQDPVCDDWKAKRPGRR